MNVFCSDLREIIMSNAHICYGGYQTGEWGRAATEKRGKYSADLRSRCATALIGLSATLIWQPITHRQMEERRKAFLKPLTPSHLGLDSSELFENNANSFTLPNYYCFHLFQSCGSKTLNTEGKMSREEVEARNQKQKRGWRKTSEVKNELRGKMTCQQNQYIKRKFLLKQRINEEKWRGHSAQ